MEQQGFSQDSIYHAIYGAAPQSATYDIVGTMVFVSVLLFIDVALRFIIELVNYNKATNRECTFINMIKALWFGWGTVAVGEKEQRFLVSKGFRNSLILKVALEYPALFTLAVAAYALPDLIIFGYRVDAMFSFGLSMIPVLCEISSIIEKLNELDVEALKWVDKAIKYIRSI